MRPNEDIERAEARLASLREAYDGNDAFELLKAMILGEFAGRMAVVSSFGAEFVVLLQMVSSIDRATPVLFLDTGFHFAETLDYQREITYLLGLSDVRILRPETDHEQEFDVGRDLHQTHPNVCCFFRKVRPLRKGLRPFDAWISGRKPHQGASRADLDLFERDGRHIKINPLVTWTADDIDTYFSRHALPIHPLVDQGYPSIGCEPCTTPVAPSEDARAGRWRELGIQECGIHIVAGQAVRGPA